MTEARCWPGAVWGFWWRCPQGASGHLPCVCRHGWHGRGLACCDARRQLATTLWPVTQGHGASRQRGVVTGHPESPTAGGYSKRVRSPAPPSLPSAAPPGDPGAEPPLGCSGPCRVRVQRNPAVFWGRGRMGRTRKRGWVCVKPSALPGRSETAPSVCEHFVVPWERLRSRTCAFQPQHSPPGSSKGALGVNYSRD